MKKIVALACLFASSFSFAGSFTDYARIVAVEPAYETQIVRECGVAHEETSRSSESSNVVGEVVGGVLGGVVGNQIGRGKGNVLATVVGAVGGAAVGRGVSRDSETTRVRECSDVKKSYRSGYDVTYEYQGTSEMTRMSYDPGVGSQMRISVNFTPIR
jgi:uncharacterized protein YcfJ